MTDLVFQKLNKIALGLLLPEVLAQLIFPKSK